MYRGIGGRRSLSEENLRTSARCRRNNVTLNEHSVKFERMADLKKERGGYASHLTRKRDELKSLLDSGPSVDRVQKGIAQVRAALRNLSDCNNCLFSYWKGLICRMRCPGHKCTMLWLRTIAVNC